MKHLFDAELHHTGGVAISPTGPIDGKLVGGGAGKALGPLVMGKMRWSLYENTAAVGCSMQLPGEITTDDGALIEFEARGQAIVPDDKAPSRWKVGGAFRFQTKDERYLWLNTVLALWDGDFDNNAGKAFYRLYIPHTDRQQKQE
jgi:hypothetical protein